MKHLLTIVLLIIPLFGEQPKCKGNPKVIAACYTVHMAGQHLGQERRGSEFGRSARSACLVSPRDRSPMTQKIPSLRKTSQFLMVSLLFTAISKSVLLHASEKATCKWSV